MLEIRVLLSDVDYDAACEKIAPLLADKMQEKGGIVGAAVGKREHLVAFLRRVLRKKNQVERDRWVAELATKHRTVLMKKAADLAAEQGVDVRVCDVSVRQL